MTRRAALAVLLIVLAGLILTPPGRIGINAVLLLPHFFPGDVPRPLRSFTPPPTVATIEVPGAPGRMVADVHRPSGGGRWPAMILLLGVNPLPRNHEQVTTLAEGIARSGIVTVVAESEALVAGEIRAEEVDNLVALFQHLERDPGIDPTRIGFSGFCIGAVLELMAAADPRIADRVAYINAFSVYADTLDVLRSILTETMPTPDGPARWTPDDLTRSVFTTHILAALPSEEDRALLSRELLQGAALSTDEVTLLTPLGRQLRDLLGSRQPAEVDARIAQLPEGFRESLRRLSPGAVAHRLRATVFLMHDQSDTYLPVSGARNLAALLPAATGRHYTEFRLFAHVVPGGVDDPLLFAGEIVKLFRHVHSVLTVAQTRHNGQ